MFRFLPLLLSLPSLALSASAPLTLTPPENAFAREGQTVNLVCKSSEALRFVKASN